VEIELKDPDSGKEGGGGGRERGKEERRKGGRERGREGGRKGGREGGREGGGGKAEGWAGGGEGKRLGGREGGRERGMTYLSAIWLIRCLGTWCGRPSSSARREASSSLKIGSEYLSGFSQNEPMKTRTTSGVSNI